jgi:hypothetical protein
LVVVVVVVVVVVMAAGVVSVAASFGWIRDTSRPPEQDFF